MNEHDTDNENIDKTRTTTKILGNKKSSNKRHHAKEMLRISFPTVNVE